MKPGALDSPTTPTPAMHRRKLTLSQALDLSEDDEAADAEDTASSSPSSAVAARDKSAAVLSLNEALLLEEAPSASASPSLDLERPGGGGANRHRKKLLSKSMHLPMVSRRIGTGTGIGGIGAVLGIGGGRTSSVRKPPLGRATTESRVSFVTCTDSMVTVLERDELTDVDTELSPSRGRTLSLNEALLLDETPTHSPQPGANRKRLYSKSVQLRSAIGQTSSVRKLPHRAPTDSRASFVTCTDSAVTVLERDELTDVDTELNPNRGRTLSLNEALLLDETPTHSPQPGANRKRLYSKSVQLRSAIGQTSSVRKLPHRAPTDSRASFVTCTDSAVTVLERDELTDVETDVKPYRGGPVTLSYSTLTQPGTLRSANTLREDLDSNRGGAEEEQRPVTLSKVSTRPEPPATLRDELTLRDVDTDRSNSSSSNSSRAQNKAAPNTLSFSRMAQAGSPLELSPASTVREAPPTLPRVVGAGELGGGSVASAASNPPAADTEDVAVKRASMLERAAMARRLSANDDWSLKRKAPSRRKRAPDDSSDARTLLLRDIRGSRQSQRSRQDGSPTGEEIVERCPACNAPAKGSHAFCVACGADLAKDEAAAAPSSDIDTDSECDDFSTTGFLPSLSVRQRDAIPLPETPSPSATPPPPADSSIRRIRVSSHSAGDVDVDHTASASASSAAARVRRPSAVRIEIPGASASPSPIATASVYSDRSHSFDSAALFHGGNGKKRGSGSVSTVRMLSESDLQRTDTVRALRRSPITSDSRPPARPPLPGSSARASFSASGRTKRYVSLNSQASAGEPTRVHQNGAGSASQRCKSENFAQSQNLMREIERELMNANAHTSRSDKFGEHSDSDTLCDVDTTRATVSYSRSPSSTTRSSRASASLEATSFTRPRSSSDSRTARPRSFGAGRRSLPAPAVCDSAAQAFLRLQTASFDEQMRDFRKLQEDYRALEGVVIKTKLQLANKSSEAEELEIRLAETADQNLALVDDLNAALSEKASMQAQIDKLSAAVSQLSNDRQVLHGDHHRRSSRTTR